MKNIEKRIYKILENFQQKEWMVTNDVNDNDDFIEARIQFALKEVKTLVEEAQKEARKKDIFDIIVTNEDSTILWVSSEDANSEEDAYAKFVEYMCEAGIDLEFFMPPSNLTWEWGRWEPIKDDSEDRSEWIEDENGELWYRIVEHISEEKPSTDI